MPSPSRLYKYEPFTPRALQNLKEQVIYFGSPLNFNDPYDCALTPRIKHPTDAGVERLRLHYLSDPAIPDKARRDFETMSVPDLRRVAVRCGEKAFADGIMEFLTHRGVSCFSEVNDSLLLWSHYGESCKGFCLEFRTDKAPFEKLHQVNYSDEMPEIDVVPFLCGEDRTQFLDLYRTKAMDWKYEREWRCIHNKAGTAYRYDSAALTGVYLGPDMPFSRFEIIAMVLAGQHENVQLWQGSRSKSAFNVEFDRVTYTPHLEAKRLGLL
jgi:hypothetical protein